MNLVRHLAANFPLPFRARDSVGSDKFYSPTMYIYIYVTKDGIDYKIVIPHSKYEGSRKDHYYRIKVATIENSRPKQQSRVCGCAPSMKLFPG